jgi:hypothetical protein
VIASHDSKARGTKIEGFRENVVFLSIFIDGKIRSHKKNSKLDCVSENQNPPDTGTEQQKVCVCVSRENRYCTVELNDSCRTNR